MFEVTPRDTRGRGQTTCRVVAGSASEAVARVRSMAHATPGLGEPSVYAVYRRRRLRGRRFVGLWSGPGPDGGQAGVREPRRPLPAPPSLTLAIDLPHEVR